MSKARVLYAIVCLLIITLFFIARVPGLINQDNCFKTEIKDTSTWLGEDTITLISYTDNRFCSKDVVIPNEINGFSVSVIESNAFSNMGINSVQIPDTVRYIKSHAFSDNFLHSITIPASVLSIDNNAFSNNQIYSLVFEEGIQHIFEYAFESNNITSITIPGSIEVIGDNSFSLNPIEKVVFIDEERINWFDWEDIGFPIELLP